MNNGVMRFRLVGMLLVCLAIPPLLTHYVGSAAGALGAMAAAALWYSQYRLPKWEEGRSLSFWFVVSGYGVFALTLLFCLGQLLGVRLI